MAQVTDEEGIAGPVQEVITMKEEAIEVTIDVAGEVAVEAEAEAEVGARAIAEVEAGVMIKGSNYLNENNDQ